MPIKLNPTNENSVITSSIPVYGNGYNPPSHKQVIEASKKILADNNITIATAEGEESIKFIGSNKNEIVAAYFVVDVPSNDTYQLVFSWVNSYTRSMRFKCAVGCRLKTNPAVYVKHYFSVKKGGDISDIIKLMENVIQNAYSYYDNTIAEIEALSFKSISREETCCLLGNIFFNKNLVTPHQASTIQKWMTETFKDVSNWKLSDVYEMLSLVTYTYHPRFWLSAHSELHEYLTDSFDSIIPIESTLNFNNVSSSTPVVVETENDIEEKLDMVVEEESVVPEPVAIPEPEKVETTFDENFEQESRKIEYAVVEETVVAEEEDEEVVLEESKQEEEEKEEETIVYDNVDDDDDFGNPPSSSTVTDEDFIW